MLVHATAPGRGSFAAARATGRAASPGRHVRLLLLLVLALLLVGCSKQELHTGLGENQANDMVAVLQNAGIDADKSAGEKGKFSVSVSNGDFARAVDVLRANGLPRDDYASLGTVFQKGTYNSSQAEEHARLTYALQQELTNTISQIDGVVEARVHLNLPQKEALSDTRQPASASVFVKYRPGYDLSTKTGQIKTLVQNSVADLTPDNISVMMERSKSIPMAKKSFYQSGLITLLVTLAGLAALAALGLGVYRWWRSRPVKTTLPAVQEDGAGR